MNDMTLPLGRDQRVTASELVRQFGLWQERAARAPVYVLHRGRPRLVLTSIELMEALCRSGGGDDGAASRLAAVLDASGEVMILIDRSRHVVASSRLARAAMPAGPGEPLDEAVARQDPMLGAAIDRVLASGAAETVELVPARRPGRRWSCVVEPAPDGALLVIRDVTEAFRHADIAAAADAGAAARAATSRMADLRINPRGYLAEPSAGLAALTGIDGDTLRHARLPALFDIADRVTVGEAIDASFAGGRPHAITARLLVNRADPVPVTLGLAPLRQGAAVAELAGAIVVNAA